MKNAIILAAGKSTHFAPFTYERPKGLFRIKNEVLIERQIKQLRAAGVEDIYVVVGYMNEKFFYLEQKYNIHLINNSHFSEKGNLYSLYLARMYMKNTYICCADHYFTSNPFLDSNNDNHSYRAVSYQKGKFREFGVACSNEHVITDITVGGQDSLAMVGHAYFNAQFSKVFRGLMESEINDFRVSSLFWEEFFSKHMKELTLFERRFKSSQILEFDSIEGLREFDSEFLENFDSEIITNICNTIHCIPNEIRNIAVINAGLTNVSFTFSVNENKYAYRHPGGTAGNLINRKSELFAQMAANKIGIDKSVIKMDLSGWKVSNYVNNAKLCNFETSSDQLITGMSYLHRIHAVSVDDTVKVFDNVAEGKRLMEIASATKGDLAREFSDIINKIDRLYPAIQNDAKRLGYELVLCHNDVYQPNYLYDDMGQMYLIDWEYAGLNYAANDIDSILCRYDWTSEQVERYLEAFVGHTLNDDEHRFYMSFIPISAFYWFCWGLYKGSVGDDDSFFFLSSYRNLVKYIDRALESYGV